MAFSLYFLIACFFLIWALVYRKLAELDHEGKTFIGRFFERVDAVILRYAPVGARYMRKIRRLFSVEIFVRAMRLVFEVVEAGMSKVKSQIIADTAPLVQALRGKREVQKEPGSVYVRSMLEYKSRLGRE